MIVKRELWAKNEPNSENNANDRRECLQLIAFDLLKENVIVRSKIEPQLDNNCFHSYPSNEFIVGSKMKECQHSKRLDNHPECSWKCQKTSEKIYNIFCYMQTTVQHNPHVHGQISTISSVVLRFKNHFHFKKNIYHKL